MNINKDELEKIINEEVEKSMIGIIKKFFEKVNIYNALKIVWLIELYYLMGNAIILTLGQASNGLNLIESYFPDIANKYNQLILTYANQWHNFVGSLGVILFFSAFMISGLKGIPKISNDNIIMGIVIMEYMQVLG